MNLLKPSTWFFKPASSGVFVQVKLDGPFGAITEIEPGSGDKPFIHFKDLSLVQAAKEIPGKSFDWHNVPMSIRGCLEMDPWCMVTEWSQMKTWVR